MTRVLAEAGFSYKNKVWIGPVGDILQGFTVDHSQYSELIYLECGVFLLPMLGSEKPVIHKAPIKERIEPEKGSSLYQLCQNPACLSDDDAFRILASELRPKLEDFFGKLDTIEKIESLARMGNPNNIASVNRATMEWFGIEPPPLPDPSTYIITVDRSNSGN